MLLVGSDSSRLSTPSTARKSYKGISDREEKDSIVNFAPVLQQQNFESELKNQTLLSHKNDEGSKMEQKLETSIVEDHFYQKKIASLDTRSKKEDLSTNQKYLEEPLIQATSKALKLDEARKLDLDTSLSRELTSVTTIIKETYSSVSRSSMDVSIAEVEENSVVPSSSMTDLFSLPEISNQPKSVLNKKQQANAFDMSKKAAEITAQPVVECLIVNESQNHAIISTMNNSCKDVKASLSLEKEVPKKRESDPAPHNDSELVHQIVVGSAAVSLALTQENSSLVDNVSAPNKAPSFAVAPVSDPSSFQHKEEDAAILSDIFILSDISSADDHKSEVVATGKKEEKHEKQDSFFEEQNELGNFEVTPNDFSGVIELSDTEPIKKLCDTEAVNNKIIDDIPAGSITETMVNENEIKEKKTVEVKNKVFNNDSKPGSSCEINKSESTTLLNDPRINESTKDEPAMASTLRQEESVKPQPLDKVVSQPKTPTAEKTVVANLLSNEKKSILSSLKDPADKTKTPSPRAPSPKLPKQVEFSTASSKPAAKPRIAFSSASSVSGFETASRGYRRPVPFANIPKRKLNDVLKQQDNVNKVIEKKVKINLC